MHYMLQLGGRYYFNRRIPTDYRDYDSREVIRFSLKTKDYKIACRRAVIENDRLESYWNSLLQSGNTENQVKFVGLANRAQALGFSYHPAAVIAELPIELLIKRLLHIELQKYNEKHVEAVLGKSEQPTIELAHVLDHFFKYSKDKLLNKSPNQIRKWENPRKKAMANFIKCIGNKPLHELTRQDMLKFKDWWIERIKIENLVSSSANKDIIYVKTIITTVGENLKIDLDFANIFKKLLISNDDGKRRLPFDTEYITTTLLNPDKLKGLNEQAKWAIHAFAETGAGLNELTGLLPEDIILNADIPHIIIRARKTRSLKTKFRNRIIPLVGYALDAFKACPNGFTQYHDTPDSLSGAIGKYLRENNLIPTNQHTIYSLRHSFQDRLLAVNTPDRIQADLMGHKFGRPSYGDGATLAHKLEWMQKIQLKKYLY